MSMRWLGKIFFVVSVVAMSCLPARAQADAPRETLFAGYSYFWPNASIGGVAFDQASAGYVFSSTTFLSRYVGLQIETGGHFASNVNIGTVQGGLVARYPYERVTPFIHADVGSARFTPGGLEGKFGVSITAGGGVDVHVHKAISWRIIQADFLYSHDNFTPAGPRLNPISARIATGLVWNVGSAKK